ncbi:MAG: hypothetical protein QM608_02455 [Caulobacter sp.]
MPDLSRLSDAERRALLLLARGHTAKSAAVELGASESAVNERLREARRKTGAGSSRELARLVAEEASHAPSAGGSGEPDAMEAGPPSGQETWDKKIGVARRRPPGQRGERFSTLGAAWPRLAGVFAMIVLAASIGAFAALAVAQRPAAEPQEAAASPPPRVVAVSPAPGAVVPAGRLALTVTFDQPMRPSWSFVMRDRASFPDCDPKPVQSPDRRSFTLACAVRAGRAYEVGFNNARHRNFASEAGIPAAPAVVRFTAR